MVNEIMVIGRLGQDPEQVGSGYKLSIASTENWKDKNDEWQEKTTWFNVIYWGKFAPNVNKGDIAYVKGSMECNKQGDTTYWNLKANQIKRIAKNY